MEFFEQVSNGGDNWLVFMIHGRILDAVHENKSVCERKDSFDVMIVTDWTLYLQKKNLTWGKDDFSRQNKWSLLLGL